MSWYFGGKIMKKRLIYLVRHGETERGTDKKYFIGRTDVDLSALGMKQAEQLSQKFKNIPLNHIYCSNLQRTMKIAKLISLEHCIEPICIEEIAEINMGEWDGRSFDEIKSLYPLEFEKRGRDIPNYRVPGGESINEFSQRVTKKFYEILDKTDGNMLFVVHAGVNRVLICDILDIPLKNMLKITQNYGCINTLSYNEKAFKIKRINE